MTAQVAINLNLASGSFGGLSGGFKMDRQSGGVTSILQGPGFASVGSAAANPALAAVTGAVVALGMLKDTTIQLVNEFRGMAERLSSFSPEISAAKAKQGALDIQADIRRAKETGPDLAQFVTAQSELNRTIEDIKQAFLKPFLKVVNTIMGDINELLKVVGPAVQFTGEVLAEMFEFIRWTLTELVKLLKHIPGIAALAEEMKQKWDRQTMGNDIGMEINRFLDPAMQEGYSLPRSKPEPQPPEADFFPATS